MPPASAPQYVFTTIDDVEALLSADGVAGRLDDDADATNDTGELAYMTQAINWATSRVWIYLSRYSAQSLAQSWLVNYWCTIVAAHIVSGRRGNPPAGSIAEAYEQTMEDLKLVRSGELTLPDAAVRDSAFPAWSNLGRPSLYHNYKRLRVQGPISSRKGDRSGVIRNFPADVAGAYETYP